MTKIFRLLILAAALSFCMSLLSNIYHLRELDQNELDILSWVAYGTMIDAPVWFYTLTTFLWIPVFIGTYFFISIARTTYLVLIIVYTLCIPFTGMFIATGTQMLFVDVSSTLDGAILAMAYFTSVSGKFKNA